MIVKGRSSGRPSRLVLLGALVALTATACQVRTTVAVDVADDGSGTVEVAVGLDAEAVGRLPDLDDDGRSTAADLAGLVRTDDLAAAGWHLSDPAADPSADDGAVWIRATKPFGTPEEAGRVLGEITGTDGPLRDLRVDRDDSFGRTRFTFEGAADLSGGLEAFGDEGLAAALDGEVLGEDAAAVEEELGRPLADMFTLEISADLPGDSTAVVWAPVLGGPPVEMAATGTVRDWWVLGLAALAVACGVGLVVLLLVQVLRRVRVPARVPAGGPAISSEAPARQTPDNVPTSPKEPPMPTRESAPVGAPCWIELFTSDVERGRAFYGELFGWTSDDPAEELGGYFTFYKDGIRVAGGMHNDGQSGTPDTWSVYLACEDAKATAEAAKANGGQVIADPMEVMDLGSMLVVSDTGGAVIGGWQPGTHQGFGIHGEPDTPSWFELHTRDYDASVDFYRKVFAWDAHVASDTPDLHYTTLGEGETALAGIMDASAFLPDGVPAHWSIYFGTEDSAATLAKVVELGGSIVEPATDTPYGRLATAADPSGIRFKLLQPPTAA
jgi:predicted enzyme related to lactoylglutathione lyase